MELIDREQILERAKQTAYYFAIKGILTEIPTVDVVLVVHGRWFDPECDDGKTIWHCNICDYPISNIAGYPSYSYCPNCGAMMDVPNLDTEGGAT